MTACPPQKNAPADKGGEGEAGHAAKRGEGPVRPHGQGVAPHARVVEDVGRAACFVCFVSLWGDKGGVRSLVNVLWSGPQCDTRT